VYFVHTSKTVLPCISQAKAHGSPWQNTWAPTIVGDGGGLVWVAAWLQRILGHVLTSEKQGRFSRRLKDVPVAWLALNYHRERLRMRALHTYAPTFPQRLPASKQRKVN